MVRGVAANISEIIKEQYREYPYPVRDPESERGRLIYLVGSSLAEINHWLFQGKESFEKGFRVLVAGGGTGDASTFLAWQLQNSDAEIVYLDFSEACLEIAKKRAEIRGLKNIHWVCDSILHLSKLNLGKFDYIDCTGVLHHLESPILGLNFLKNSLTERGGMNLMLYGKYGRTAVYQIQELLRNFVQEAKNRKEEIQIARKVLASLPKDHLFSQLPKPLLEESKTDQGFYDLFLHKQDRAYTVSEIYQLVEKSGLHFIDFFEPAQRMEFLAERYIQDEELLSQVRQFSPRKQQEIVELLSGNMFRHAFCVSKKKDCKAELTDLDLVPFLAASSDILSKLRSQIQNWEILQNYSSISLNLGFFRIELPLSPWMRPFFDWMDEKRSLREIFAAIRQEFRTVVSNEKLTSEIKPFLEPLIRAGILLLRDRSVKPFPNWFS